MTKEALRNWKDTIWKLQLILWAFLVLITLIVLIFSVSPSHQLIHMNLNYLWTYSCPYQRKRVTIVVKVNFSTVLLELVTFLELQINYLVQEFFKQAYFKDNLLINNPFKKKGISIVQRRDFFFQPAPTHGFISLWLEDDVNV